MDFLGLHESNAINIKNRFNKHQSAKFILFTNFINKIFKVTKFNVTSIKL